MYHKSESFHIHACTQIHVITVLDLTFAIFFVLYMCACVCVFPCIQLIIGEDNTLIFVVFIFAVRAITKLFYTL